MSEKPPTKTDKHEQKPIKCRNKASVHSLHNEGQILVDKICLCDSLSFVIPDTFIYNFSQSISEADLNVGK